MHNISINDIVKMVMLSNVQFYIHMGKIVLLFNTSIMLAFHTSCAVDWFPVLHILELHHYKIWTLSHHKSFAHMTAKCYNKASRSHSLWRTVANWQWQCTDWLLVKWVGFKWCTTWWVLCVCVCVFFSSRNHIQWTNGYTPISLSDRRNFS